MKITNVLDNNEKKNTYSYLCKKCKEEMSNNNYEAVLVLSYAMIEDRLKSFLHYLFVIDKDKGIFYPTDEVDIIIRPLCHFNPDSEKSKVYKLNNLSSKLKVLKAIINNKDKHQYLLDCFKIIDKNIGIDKLRKWIKSVEEWSDIRNEIIHASFGKNIDSLNNALEKCARDGEKLSKDIKTFTNKIKDNKYQISVRTKWSAITILSNENKDYCTDEFIYDKAYPFVLDKDDYKVEEIISFDILNPSYKNFIDDYKEHIGFVVYFFCVDVKRSYECKIFYSLILDDIYRNFKKKNCHYFLKLMYLKLVNVLGFYKEMLAYDFNIYNSMYSDLSDEYFEYISEFYFLYIPCLDKSIKYMDEVVYEFGRENKSFLSSEYYEEIVKIKDIDFYNDVEYEIITSEIMMNDYYTYTYIYIYIYIDKDYYDKELFSKCIFPIFNSEDGKVIENNVIFRCDELFKTNEVYNIFNGFKLEYLADIMYLLNNPQVRDVYINLDNSFENFITLYMSVMKKIEKIKEKYDSKKIKMILRKIKLIEGNYTYSKGDEQKYCEIIKSILKDDYCFDSLCYGYDNTIEVYKRVSKNIDIDKIIKCLEYMERNGRYLIINNDLCRLLICDISKDENNYILNFRGERFLIGEVLSLLKSDKIFFKSDLNNYYYRDGKVLIDEVNRIMR